ncbi:hypothetical protein LR48_Vigan01g061300 [Vigna angularis]|uniref:Uncharacterized protein n=1 Tax=Phaseolus angularis TaxID=3914 RepID=A0A0L9TKD9_PHAAN|nr:hypothetical protein LR48_Vigan01g061300 [Vigna angularis]
MHERHLSRLEGSEVRVSVQVSDRETTSTLHLLQLLSRTSQTSLFCNSPFPSPITFQNRRNVRLAVIFLLDRTEFGSELTKWKLLSEPGCRTLLEVKPKTLHLGVHCYPDGGASLEEMLEEENLEDATLVDVEVKAEP